MITPATLAAFAATSLVIIALPGPSVLFVIGRSLALGRWSGVLSVIGNALGTVPAVLAVSFGLGALLAASVVYLTIVKVAGGLYLMWLGVRAIRRRHLHTNNDKNPHDTSPALLLRQAFVVGITNPKTIAFFVAVLPQFVTPTAGPIWAQLLTLGLTFQLLALICDSIWALAAGIARSWFARSPAHISHLSATGGIMMIGLGGTLALTAAKP